MGKYKVQSHVVWQCGYHIVWCPKYRFRILTGIVKDLVEHEIRMICEWKSCEVQELNVQADHIHMVVSIPPKVSVSELMGILKGKFAIKLFKSYPQLKKKPYWGNHFGHEVILLIPLVWMKILFVVMSVTKKNKTRKRRIIVNNLPCLTDKNA